MKVWLEGVVQPLILLKATVCGPTLRSDTVAPLACHAPPSTLHIAPALAAAPGLIVTVREPAALFVKIASRFESDIMVAKDKTEVSGKSIMGLMTLEACCGVTLRVTAAGPDAEEVLNELQHLIESKFFEE